MTPLVKLLFVAPDPEWAEQVIAQVREQGQSVQAQQVLTATELATILQASRFDVLILADWTPGVTLGAVTAELEALGRRVPVILLCDGCSDAAQAVQLRSGAFAVVPCRNAELVALVVLRAAELKQCQRQLHVASGRLHEAERRCLLLFDSSRDPIAYIRDGRYLYTNEAWKALVQIPDDELLQRPADDWVSSDSQPLLAELLNGSESHGTMESRVTLPLRNGLGSGEPVEIILTDARVDGAHCTIVRIVSGNDAAAGPGPMATRDPVTGVFNRNFLMRAIEDAFARAARSESTFALVEVAVEAPAAASGKSLDLAELDELLTRAGGLLRDYFPNPAVVARLSDETLAVVIPGAQRENLQETVVKLLSGLDADQGREETSRLPQLVLGVVLADDSMLNAAQLVDQAHQALAEARERKSDRYCFVSAVIAPKLAIISDVEWQHRLAAALAEGGLQLVFQAMMNLHGSDRPRFTVYLRLRAADGLLIAAEEFISAAERTGIAVRLDQWVLEHALPVLAECLQTAPETLFFLKLSRGSLQDGSVIRHLETLLTRYRIPPEQVIIEIKETSLTTLRQNVAEVVQDLRRIGSGLCIDEFGNSLDVFQVLREADADFLKLDAFLVQGLATDHERLDTVRALIEGAQAKHKQVIAPLVEDAGTLALLFGLGLNLVQGYFIHPPSERPDYDFTQMI